MSTAELTNQSTPFTKKTFIETIDPRMLLTFLYSDDILQVNQWKSEEGVEYAFHNEREQIESVLNKMLKKNKQKIYKYTKETVAYLFANSDDFFEETLKVKYIYNKKRKLGRVYPAGSLGLCQIRRELRHTLSDGVYDDIDIVNAHPDILNQLTKGVYPILNDYIKNREKYFTDICGYFTEQRANLQRALGKEPDGMVYDHTKISKHRDFCKGLFVRLMYFGSYECWLTDNNLPPVEAPEWYDLLKKEMETIADGFIAENPTLTKEIKDEKGECGNIRGSVVSWVCQEHERRILEVVFEFLKKKKLIKKDDAVLCFDGLMIKCEYENKKMIIAEAEEEIKKHLGFDLKLKIKEFDEKLDDNLLKFEIPDPAEDYALETEQDSLYEEAEGVRLVSHNEGAVEVLLPELKKILIPSRRQWFLKVGNVWTNDKEYIDSYLMVYVTKSKIYKKSMGGVVPYAQDVSVAKNICELVFKNLLVQPDLVDIYEKFHATTKGRVCFLDGVLDFRARKFYAWAEVDFEYYSCIQINREFGAFFKNPDRAVMAEVKKKVYGSLFGEELERGLHFLSRAMAGHFEDKIFATYMGKRNCGKGVMYDNMKTAFECYVDPFTLKNIMYQRRSHVDNAEVERKMFWALDLEFVRLAVSQEIPEEDTALIGNGEMMKKLASGGDPITAKRNYDRFNTKINIDASFFFLGNDPLIFDAEDVDEQRLQFTSVVQFKTADEISAAREMLLLKPEDAEEMRAGGMSEADVKRYYLEKERGADEYVAVNYAVKDATIKDKCKTVEWANAAVMVLFEAYKSDAVIVPRCIDGEVTVPSGVQILQVLKITKNPADVVLAADLENRLANINKKKLVAQLKALGVVKKKHNKGEYRDKLCYFGVMLNAMVEED
jgi:hypothetical protein